MTLISASKLAEPLKDNIGASLVSTTRRWTGGNAREILPGLFLTSIVAGASFATRMLPGMTTFSPMMLSMVVGIAFHNVVGTAAWAKHAGEFGTIAKLSRVMLLAPMVIAIGWGARGSKSRKSDLDTSSDRPPIPWFVIGFVALVAVNSLITIPADAKACIVAGMTFLLSIALAAMGLETNIGKVAAKGFRPALLGGLAFLFIAGFSLTLIKLTE